MNVYLVGGAVRDQLLGLPVTERDWVIVGATEEDIQRAGFRRLDASFPVFVHPDTGEEYALARRETKTGAGYKGFTVEAGPDVSLEEDLARRDLTINAMAMDPDGVLIDPYGGQKDLAAGLLRHVTPAFAEDPVRLLRVARFAAKLGRWGFRVAHGTHAMMKRMAQGEDLAHLRPDRVWRELRLALAEDQPWRFFEVLQACGALARLLPALAGALGGGGGHRPAVPGNALRALRVAVRQGARPQRRFAALLVGAARDGADPAALHGELAAADRSYLELAAQALEACVELAAMGSAEPERLVAFLNGWRAFSQPDRLEELLGVCEAAHPADAPPATRRVRAARAAACTVDAAALAASGLRGPALRRALDRRRVEAVARALTA